MERRSFLTGMAGILLSSQAPAIASQGSLMKIWVPPEKKIITEPEPLIPAVPGMNLYIALATTEIDEAFPYQLREKGPSTPGSMGGIPHLFSDSKAWSKAWRPGMIGIVYQKKSLKPHFI